MSVAIVSGASKGIGASLARQLLARTNFHVVATCRDVGVAQQNLGNENSNRLTILPCDVTREEDIASVASTVGKTFGPGSVRLVVNSAGYLNPEKSYKALEEQNIMKHFMINTFSVMYMAKHITPLLASVSKESATWSRSIFGSISARTGSIADNKLGGWYSYRASKAAQNQITKTLAAELGRRGVITVALHPGTVDTDLSRPFVKGTHMSPDQAAELMFNTIESLREADNGTFLDQDRVLALSGLKLKEWPSVISNLDPKLLKSILDLSSNLLETLPPDIGRFNSLKTLTLANNLLSTLPDEIWSLTALQTLDLHSNRLRALSPLIVQLSNLKTLDVSKNQLASIPLELAGNKKLVTLDASYNKLKELPITLGGLPDLEEINVSNNQIAELPRELGLASKLKALRIANNSLVVFPDILQNTSLTWIEVEGNPCFTKFSELAGYEQYVARRKGRIDQFIKTICGTHMSPDQAAELMFNTIESLKIMKWLKALFGDKKHLAEKAEKADRRVVALSGLKLKEWPLVISNLDPNILKILDLSSNLLETLPPDIGRFNSLKTLTLANNLLSTLPDEIWSLTALQTLDLHNNRLQALSFFIVQLWYLKTLDVSNNQLASIPLELGWNRKLVTLDASYNKLKELPFTLGNLPDLEEINVSNNQVAEFPRVLGLPPRLKILRIANNSLVVFPDILQNSSLTWIEVEGNPCFTKFSAMAGYEQYVARRKGRIDQFIKT
ncbi:hypothetical protein SmJEL517_g04213 [Synchytrium microbalum]|uniref:Uncharacterized protein n=1 Tax=Synchytrium microbalum TaxID=1806994 RepID=A0A507C5K9_9FUNG|nr:uncharacterized protein SmJEL517_g04213 [Synchytrium microbalum]TPX32745.1 hypothetical protein SmJEL517_g04213 [Synchytrium microbalum]